MPHFVCGDFGVLLSEKKGKKNFVVHYLSSGEKDILETATKIPQKEMSFLLKVIAKQSCGSSFDISTLDI